MPFTKFWNLAPSTTEEGVLNMYVYGEIKSAATFFGSQDDVVSSEFVSDLNNYPDTSVINVYINSPGGSVFAAASIRNRLMDHAATVHTWCDGICASAAVGLLQAANPGCRHMSNATLLMVHNPSTRVQGEKSAFMKAADLLDKVKDTILNIYHESTGIAKETLSDMMDAETYLTAAEAKELNFIDLITEESTSYDVSDSGDLICNSITMDVAAEVDIERLKAELQTRGLLKTVNTKGGDSSMNFTELMASLPEDQRELILNEIQNRLEEREEALATEHGESISNMTATNTDLAAQVSALTEKLALATAKGSEEPDWMNALPEEAKNALAEARANAVAAQNALNAIQEAQEFSNFCATLEVYDNLPINDAHKQALYQLSNADADNYKDMTELLKVANQAMSGNFGELGTGNGVEVADTAYERMEAAVKDAMAANPELSYNDAMRNVLAKDPSLYDAYKNEQNV